MLDMGLVRVRVFPTRVGMNRGRASRRCVRRSVPHARGDEPLCLHAPNENYPCSHARGDEPLALALKAAALSVPHARGDEPYRSVQARSRGCVPTRVGMNRRICVV